jgi:hypothetical protein
MLERDGNVITRLILFRGWYDPWHREVSTGFDKTGYVTSDGMVLHPRRSRIAHTPLRRIEKWPHQFLDLPNLPHAELIETFFTKNVINNTFYVLALQQLPNEQSPFWKSPIKMPILEPITPAEHEARWRRMRDALQRGDGIFTFDAKSTASKIIAYLDQGTWSHVGTYSGNGNVLEVMSSGVAERTIEAYHDPRYRLGAYRLPHASAQQIDTMIAFARSQIGGSYNYHGAASLGLRLIFGLWPKATPAHTTPNMVAALAGYDIVAVV